MNNNTKAFSALALGLLLIGVSPILIKLADAPGIITAFYRMAIGGIVLTPFFLIAKLKYKTKLPKKGILLAIAAGILLGADMAFWSTGIMASNATLPTLVGNLSPLWVGIGAIFYFKEKQNTGFWLGVILAIIGISLLLLKDELQSGDIAKGVLYGLFAGIFYAGYQLSTQSGRKHLNTLNYLYFSTVSTACSLGILSIILDLSFTGYPTETWKYWLIMGIVIQVIAWFFINYSQGSLPASVVAPTLLGQPILTAIFSIPLLGEPMTIWLFTGGIIIIAGIYIVHFTRNKKKN
jgi:drug/metabolite transporter (DMT)-like permease